jgi:hypothetical protein
MTPVVASQHSDRPRGAPEQGPTSAADAHARTSFDPADPACWIAHGRPPAIAEAIASAWQLYPDLPANAPLDARQARTRDRVAAMRPAMDALAEEARRSREAANFAFIGTAFAQGSPDPRHGPILRARDHGLSWDEAVQFANGFHAATAGWDRSPPRSAAPPLISAYDAGFAEGGGLPDDLFDTARRAFHAKDESPASRLSPLPAGPVPSAWAKPTDQPRPARWTRRLLIIDEKEFVSRPFRALLQECDGAADATIIAAAAGSGYAHVDLTRERSSSAAARTLGSFIADCDYDDILVVADGDCLAMIDNDRAAIPLARTMERTRNSLLQQRQQFRAWLARGLVPGATLASGHIRWSKAIAGLSGKLGVFTARYAGPAKPSGHRIVVLGPDGRLAYGLETVAGTPLDPERIISNRGRLRSELTAMLRTFAAAMPSAEARRADPTFPMKG